jgi:hypothetical protein
MFIRNVIKKNKYSPKVFEYQQLVESIGTEKGSRQKLLLNLGKLPIPPDQWSRLAKRIESIIKAQAELFNEEPIIEYLASHYAEKFIQKNFVEINEPEDKHYESIDISSLNNQKVRPIGAEYISYSYFKRLELSKCLKACGFNKRQMEIVALLIIGRLVSPGSERHLYYWAQKVSALDELIDTDFGSLSLNSLYKVCDKILENQEIIEDHLRTKERDLFGLTDTIILYDLTNTYFEGSASSNPKAKFGKSKEKRSDCRLLTLGLVIDGKGFPKRSEVFEGNQSEPKTLLEMIGALTQSYPSNKKSRQFKPTVVIDAGLATEKNLKELKKEYHYIAVSRKKIEPPKSDDFILIKEDKKNKIEAQRITYNGEIFLYCKSKLKQNKEKSMQSRFRQNFEERLARIAQSIHKKGCTKNYQKVVERIGRLKEKYKRISRFYDIKIEDKDGLAKNITWQYIKEKSDQQFSGCYFLRTDRTDLTEKEIWEIYTMLKEIEDAFRVMKSDLYMRPIFHQKENRSDAHIFITVVCYHLLHSIRTLLKQGGINMCWSDIKERLSTHCRVTNKIKTQEGKIIYIRKCSEPEHFHRTIYDALKLGYIPCEQKKLTI